MSGRALMVERNVGRCRIDKALRTFGALPLVAWHQRASIDRELPSLDLLLLFCDVLRDLILEAAEGSRIDVAHVTLVVAGSICHRRFDH